VPVNFEVSGIKLGSWVSRQRQNIEALTPDQLKRLDSLEFSWNPHTEIWDQAYSLLHDFFKINGHSRVARNVKKDGFNIGKWVSVQRHNKAQLSPEQIRRLNEVKFSWDPFSEQWEQGFAALKKFRSREGHCRTKDKFMIDGFNLGSWVGTQRQNKDQLSSEQLGRLSTVGFCWEPLAEQWKEGFAALKEFHAREGHSKVAQTHIEGGRKLGVWVAGQRKRREKLRPDQLSRLTSLGFNWDPLTEQWEQGFSALKEFHAREGHCRVTRDVKINSLKLGTWVDIQRQAKEKLSPDQIARLDSIGFSWDPHREMWEKSFKALKSFHEIEAHCRVPVGLILDGINLNNWIGTQRTKKNHLTSEQLGRLESLGFSWDPITEQWEEGFEALKRFHRIEGHCLVPQKYTLGKFMLGAWVSRQRQNRTKLTDSRIKRLEVLGFKWK
jgi:hypothetical protein